MQMKSQNQTRHEPPLAHCALDITQLRTMCHTRHFSKTLKHVCSAKYFDVRSVWYLFSIRTGHGKGSVKVHKKGCFSSILCFLRCRRMRNRFLAVSIGPDFFPDLLE